MAGRCHGLLQAAKGELPGAVEVLEQAMVDHGSCRCRSRRRRTRLLLGGCCVEPVIGAMPAASSRPLGRLLAAGHAGAGPSRRAPSWPASAAGRQPESELTPVEERIAALVAAGQTNKEVAGALFISVRTVEGHLGHVYQKLGVRSRTELARQLPR